MPQDQPSLAPSEVVYFHPEAFAREKKLVDAVDLVHTDKKYDGSELGGAILSAAMLAAEQAGAVTLEVGKTSRLFGLRKVDAVLVKPGPNEGGLPEHALESRVRPAAARMNGKGDAEYVVRDLLQEDAPDPWKWAVALVEKGLAERKLLDVQETRRLKVFRSQSYVLPAETAEMARRVPAEPVADLFERTQRERPEVWRLLQEGVKRAVKSRVERDSGPDFD